MVEYSYVLVPESQEEKQERKDKFLETIKKISDSGTERDGYEIGKYLRHDLQVNPLFLFEVIEKTGGISAKAATEMDENSKQFKEEFWLDK